MEKNSIQLTELLNKSVNVLPQGGARTTQGFVSVDRCIGTTHSLH